MGIEVIMAVLAGAGAGSGLYLLGKALLREHDRRVVGRSKSATRAF